MKILIAYDGSANSQAAIHDLARAGLPASAHAVVLTVADVFVPPASENGAPALPQEIKAAIGRAHEQAAQAVESARRLATEASEQVRAMFPGWTVQSRARSGSPGWEIVLEAQEWDAALVVVGTRGRSAAGRLLLGSVSEQVLHNAPCSVRIGRYRMRASERPIRLMVGVDGSEGAERAVKAVAARVWPRGSEARVIAVIDNRMSAVFAPLVPGLGRWVDESDRDERAWVRRMAESAAMTVSQSGLAASALTLDGDPKEVLLREAEAWQTDCIFVGARGLGVLERFVLGSISSAVAERAICSVEIVRV